MNLLLVLVFLTFFVLAFFSSSEGQHHATCGVSIVLLGCSGDLAKRYLWPAIFQSFMARECGSAHEEKECGLLVVGGSREQGESWKDMLDNIHCHTASCELCLDKFSRLARRLKISDEADYQNVSEVLKQAYQQQNQVEIGRIFYLSVPPSACTGIVQKIHKHGRPESDAWLRVVLEKPFGSDLSSAKHVVSNLSEHLPEDQIYRVDHYLGKPGVKQILAFRQANSEKLASLWSKQHVEYVEVSVKERLDVKGRTSFFDKYGIIREMHQNHLTEILVRLLVDISDKTSFHEEKNKILTDLHPPTLQGTILGQYLEYQSHVVEDGVQSAEMTSHTPTYAAVVMYSRALQWSGVPLLLNCGKRLDERKALARVVFKKSKFSYTSSGQENYNCPAEIIFLIQDEHLRKPGILLSPHLAHLGLEYGYSGSVKERVELNQCPYEFLSLSDTPSSNAYVTLMEDIISGRRDNSVDTESLLNAWRVWDPLLKEISEHGHSQLIHYSPNTLEKLDFHIEGSKLVSSENSVPYSETCDVVKLKSFPGVHCVVGTGHQLALCLAKELQDSASSSVSRSGAFHLALPGGKSPQTLFNILALQYAAVLPWKYTHIWQTDEHCVKHNDSDSNWNQIIQLLVSQVPIPFHHLHPMPVELQNGLCSAEDDGCGLYEKQLQENIGGVEPALDHVMLGVGSDGHIASLFPSLTSRHSPAESSQERTVQLTRPQQDKHPRMSLTYGAISAARAVSVLITGEHKEALANAILSKDGHLDTDTPLTIVLKNTEAEKIRLYVDRKLLS